MYGVNCCSVADFALRRFWTSHAFAFSVSQHRAKEVIDDPPLKSFRRQDATRKRNGKAAINYPHEPTELQKQKLEQYDAYRETLFAAKGKRVAKEKALKLDAL